jgi:Leucine-rich repeat (LRR) protein
VGILQLDNITRGTWKPHFFEGDLFGGCSSLTILSGGLGNLISLKGIDLGRCSSLITLPEGLGNLTSLTKISLGGCLSTTTLPEGLVNLTSLTKIDLGDVPTRQHYLRDLETSLL